MDHTLAASPALSAGGPLFFRDLPGQLPGDQLSGESGPCASAPFGLVEPGGPFASILTGHKAHARDDRSWWHRQGASSPEGAAPGWYVASEALDRLLEQRSLGVRQPEAARLTAHAHVRARQEAGYIRARDLRARTVSKAFEIHRDAERDANRAAVGQIAAKQVKLHWGLVQDFADRNRFARPLDVALSLAMLVAFAPLMALVALIVWVVDPGPVIFAHRRVGRNGHSFPCYKFRSMYVGAEQRLAAILAEDAELRAMWERDHKLPDDPRITRVGKLLRATSLDELPQLINVLRGDMSLVGPRPIVRAETRRYGRYLRHYLAVRPGLTGLWQVSGRSDTTYRRRVAADVHYARRRTFGFDVRILVATLPAVISGKGSC